MIEVPYTASNLSACFSYKDTFKERELVHAEKRNLISQETLNKINTGKIYNNPIKKIEIRGKEAFVFNEVAPELATRLVAKNIRKNYNAQQSDRHHIISTLISLLHDGTPYHIYRFDVKEFYESIDRKELLFQLTAEEKCSPTTIRLLEELFRIFDFHSIRGLPRGLSISSTLSEVYLKAFDENMGKLSDIFFYSRFVDDIIVISSDSIPKKEMERVISEKLPESLEFHKQGKKSHLSLPKINNNSSRNQRFEYLGYYFKVYESYSGEKGQRRQKRKVDIDISPEKVSKIKQRLASSFAHYLAGPKNQKDYLLLKNRIRALSGNYIIKDPITGIGIKTGIYFNYMYADIATESSLKDLDNFFRRLLFSKKDNLSKKISKEISLPERRWLSGYSFTTGFRNVRYHSFNYKTLKEIKECWKK